MRELEVCQALIDQIEEMSETRRGGRVRSVLLSLGQTSPVEPHLLRHAYQLVSCGTVMEGADLVIEWQPQRIRCPQCATEADAKPERLACPDCGHWPTELLSSAEDMVIKLLME